MTNNIERFAKELSSSFSSGGGGNHFERHINASFLTLMLSGGFAPCMPCWPINKMEFQTRSRGYNLDDVVIYVKNPSNNEERKLLVQIKHRVNITQKDKNLQEVLKAAWYDYTNSKIFSPKKDKLALITGPLSKIDTYDVRTILDKARHSATADDFFTEMNIVVNTSNKQREKLNVFKIILKSANNNKDLNNTELFEFLRAFNLLGYDLGNEFGVCLSLLHSHMCQYNITDPTMIWALTAETVSTWAKDGGSLTKESTPESLQLAYTQKPIIHIPQKLTQQQEKLHPKEIFISKLSSEQRIALTYAIIIGSWNDTNISDHEYIENVTNHKYLNWLNHIQTISVITNSDITHKNNKWKIHNKKEYIKILGNQLFNNDIKRFADESKKVLSETAFSLRNGDTFFKRSNEFTYSKELRNGITEGLALISTEDHQTIPNCTRASIEKNIYSTVVSIFKNNDWRLWASFSIELKNIAEAHPDAFILCLNKILNEKDEPLKNLFDTDDSLLASCAHQSGLLWALETLAWSEEYFAKIFIILTKWASMDPGGRFSNRPANTLWQILLPWLPQTKANCKSRYALMKTTIEDYPEIAWNLLMEVLPGRHSTSHYTERPQWRNPVPENWNPAPTIKEYHKQVYEYSLLAFEFAKKHLTKMPLLIRNISSLSPKIFGLIIDFISSTKCTKLSDNLRLPIWEALLLVNFKHKKHKDAKWAFSKEKLQKLEKGANKIAPQNLLKKYRYLFNHNDREFVHYKKEQELKDKRIEALKDIHQQMGEENIIAFAKQVKKPDLVGLYLGELNIELYDSIIIPRYLNAQNTNLALLASSYVSQRHCTKGWDWIPKEQLKSWNIKQAANFLLSLPCTSKTWELASWLKSSIEKHYWTNCNPYRIKTNNADYAANKFIENDRPYAAITVLNITLTQTKKINAKLTIKALMADKSKEISKNDDMSYEITELIKKLQTMRTVHKDNLISIELCYIDLLNSISDETFPQTVERQLAENPSFFCEIIQLRYRSQKPNYKPKKYTAKEEEFFSKRIWSLLHYWRIPPGLTKTKKFSERKIQTWLKEVKAICKKTGHLEVALTHLGHVLYYAPSDPNGLWIHKAAAKVLNNEKICRQGFYSETINSRGFHWVDTSGSEDIKLSNLYKTKAHQLELAGYHNFASTINLLANHYKHEANRIMDEHS